jgi:hypothetical protein
MIRKASLLAVALTALVVLPAGAGSAVSDGLTLVRIASDPFAADVPGAHATVVEPSAVAVGSTIVTASRSAATSAAERPRSASRRRRTGAGRGARASSPG